MVSFGRYCLFTMKYTAVKYYDRLEIESIKCFVITVNPRQISELIPLLRECSFSSTYSLPLNPGFLNIIKYEASNQLSNLLMALIYLVFTTRA